MKSLCAAWILFISFAGHGQRIISSYRLSVTFKKTTNIIFPFRIEKADIGSADVIGHKDPMLGNVLFLKASRKDFAPTNLSVYTSDGKFYSFIVSYKESPDTLNVCFKDSGLENRLVDSFMASRLESNAVRVLDQPSFLHRKSKSQDIKVILKGVYLLDDMMWFTLLVKNRSQISYKPAFIQFSIRDKKAGKRTAVQETEIPFSWGNTVKPIPGHDREAYVFAFHPFTVSGQKKLVFHMEEKKGERTIIVDIPASTILKARLVQ